MRYRFLKLKDHINVGVERIDFYRSKISGRQERQSIRSGSKPGVFRKQVRDPAVGVRLAARKSFPFLRSRVDFEDDFHADRWSAAGDIEDVCSDGTLHYVRKYSGLRKIRNGYKYLVASAAVFELKT